MGFVLVGQAQKMFVEDFGDGLDGPGKGGGNFPAFLLEVLYS